MADRDIHQSKVEQQNVGRATENPISNAQNEAYSVRGTVPNTGKAEIASQTEAMTKGDKPILPAFDMSGFGDSSKKSQDSSLSATRGSADAANANNNKDGSAEVKTTPNSPDVNNNKDGSAEAKTTPNNPDTNNNKNGSSDGKTGSNSPDANTSGRGSSDGSSKPTSDVPTRVGSDTVVVAPASTNAMTGSAISAGSQTPSSR